MFRTKFNRVADSVFYMLGGNNAFNYSKAIDKVEGYVSPLFAAIAARMQGPNREKYGFIYRVGKTKAHKLKFCSLSIDRFSITEVMDTISQLIQALIVHRTKEKLLILLRNSK